MCLGVVLIVATVVLWPVIKSPFCGDDTIDSLHPMRLKYSGQSPWSLIWDITNSWRESQGRFFPVSVAIGVMVHQIFPDLGPYKVVQLLVVLVGLSLFVYLVKLLTHSFRVGIVAALVLVSTFQFRVQYDPILQFSIQQPSVVIFVLGTMVLLILGTRSQSTWLLAGASLTYTCALLTYETVLLFVPMLVAIIAIEKREGFVRRSLWVVIPASAVAANLIYLRLNTSTTAAGYTSDLSPSNVVPTFLKQAFGAVPFSYAQVNTPPFIQKFPEFVDIRTARTWFVVVFAGTLLLGVLRGLPRISKKSTAVLAICGASMWFLPAFVVSQTVRWQQEVVWGNAYVPVYMEYFGFTMTAIAVVMGLHNLLMGRPQILRVVAAAVLVSLTVGGSVAASSNNRLAVKQYNPGYLWSRQFFERSIERGVFNLLQNDERLFTSGGQLWYEPAFINWWGGPRLTSVVDGIGNPEYSECVAEAETCSNNFDGAFVQYGIFPTEIRAMLLSSDFSVSSDGNALNSVLLSKPYVYVELLRNFERENQRIARCKSWLASRTAAQGITLTATEIQPLRTDGNWCLVRVSAEVMLDAAKFTPNG